MATPLTWVEAPARVKRPNTSLDVIPVVEVGSDHFVGFHYMADPCVFPGLVPIGCYNTIGPVGSTPKTFGGVGPTLDSEVFGVYAGVECSLNGGIEDFETIARRVLENGEYQAVDGVLAGILTIEGVATTPATFSDVATLIAALEQALAENVPGRGYIYLSAYLATLAASDYVVFRNLDGTLETALGTPIVVLTNPSWPDNAAAASGQVTIWRTPIEVVRAPDVTVNTGRALAERLYTFTIECGIWKTTYVPAAPVGNEEPEPEQMVMTLGSIPSSPIPDGTSTTIIVQTTEEPDGDVTLHFTVNGGAEETRTMIQTETLQFVHAATGDLTTTGDSVELWATADDNGVESESNHITIEVI